MNIKGSQGSDEGKIFSDEPSTIPELTLKQKKELKMSHLSKLKAAEGVTKTELKQTPKLPPSYI